MKPLISILFAAAFASLLGCDEEKQAPGNSAQPARTPSAAAATTSSATSPQLLNDIRAAAAPGSGSENDPGRVTFDGDKTQARSLTVPGAVFAGNTAPGSQPKTSYTAPGNGNTLTVAEPPPPTGSSVNQKPFSIASALGVSDPTTKKDASGIGRDATGVDSITGASRSDGRTPASCPQGMASVEGYCIDKYEGSLESDGKPWPGYAKLDPAKSYKALSQVGVKPQAYISGDQAAAACSAAGKRLCSVKEWVKACQGPVKTQYPYGAAYEPGACNEFDHKDHAGHRSAMHRLFGDDAPYTYGPMNDPRLDQMPETVAPSGAFDKCTNAYGVYDMVGNVHEWVADKAGGKGLFKGGYFEDTHLNGDGCRYTTSAHETSYHDYSTGFRCCADPS